MSKGAAMRAMKDPPPTPSPMVVSDAYLIPLGEIPSAPTAWFGEELRPAVEDWGRRNGVTVRYDWRGVPGLIPSEAYKVRVGAEAAQAEHDAAWRVVLEAREERKRAEVERRRLQREAEEKAQAAIALRLGEAHEQYVATRGPDRDVNPPPDLSLEDAKKIVRKRGVA